MRLVYYYFGTFVLAANNLLLFSWCYQAMARDRKLNPEQHTPAQLRKKCEVWNKHGEELGRLEGLLKEAEGGK
jgi:hypothetical protein